MLNIIQAFNDDDLLTTEKMFNPGYLYTDSTLRGA